MGRGGSRGDRPASGSSRVCGRHPRLMQDQDRRIQTAKVDLLHCRKRNAKDRHGKGPAPGSPRQVCRSASTEREGRGDMTDSGNSSDGFSGVVMGKAAGAALAGERARESASTGTPKIDGGALVARVLQSQGVKYLF